MSKKKVKKKINTCNCKMASDEDKQCECDHYERYIDMLGYTTMMRNMVRDTREENLKLRYLVTHHLQHVDKLQTVNQAFQIKIGRAGAEFKAEFERQQKHYVEQLSNMQNQYQRAVDKLQEQANVDMVEAIMVIEQLKQKIRTLEQKNEQGPRSNE